MHIRLFYIEHASMISLGCRSAWISSRMRRSMSGLTRQQRSRKDTTLLRHYSCSLADQQTPWRRFTTEAFEHRRAHCITGDEATLPLSWMALGKSVIQKSDSPNARSYVCSRASRRHVQRHRAGNPSAVPPSQEASATDRTCAWRSFFESPRGQKYLSPANFGMRGMGSS
jgi:hypothetical protein